MLTIEIPNLEPISANKMWRRSAQGGIVRTHLDPEASAYMQSVAIITKSQAKGKGIPQGELSVEIHFGAPTAHWYTKGKKIRIRDLDNLAKLTVDGVFDGLGVNDSHIWDLRLRKLNTRRFHTTVMIRSCNGLCPNCPQNRPKHPQEFLTKSKKIN